MARGKVKVSITGDADGLKRSTRQAEGDLGRLESRGGRAMRGLAKAGGAALLGIGAAAVATAPKLISLASDAEETASKFRTVFGKETDAAIKQLDRFSKATGTSRFALREQAAGLQALIRPMGLQTKEAAKMSVGLTQLATDLASFNNTEVQEAMTALQSGLVGEAEPMRRFGVQLSAARVEAFALSKGLVKTEKDSAAVSQAAINLEKAHRAATIATRDHGKGSLEAREALLKVEDAEKKLKEARKGTNVELTAAQKAQAAYGIILEDTKLAQGDATKTADSFANQFKRLKNQVIDVATEMGMKLLPTAKKVVSAITGFINEMRTGEGAGGRFATKVKEIATEIWPVVRGIGQAAGSIARFAGGMVQAIGPATTLGAVIGGLVGRFAGLRIAGLITGMVGLATAFRAADGAAGGLAGRMAILNGVTRANPFVMLATVIGTVAGALFGMKLKSDSAKVSGQQLNDMLRQQADLMRQVRDIDISVAQAKANLNSANVAVAQAEQRLRELRKSGTASATDIKAAEADLEQARIQQIRATREINGTESASRRIRQDAAEQTRKIIKVEQEKLKEKSKDIKRTEEIIDSYKTYGEVSDFSARVTKRYKEDVAKLSRQKGEARAITIRLKEQQLALAEATGASSHTVDRLKREIAGLKSKEVTVTAKVKLQAVSGALESVRGLLGADGRPGGDGLPLTRGELDEALTKDARRNAQKRADRIASRVSKALSSVSGMLGGRGASGVDAFTPMSLRMGLSGARGPGQAFRPGSRGWHGVNRARDHSGPPAKMMAFARYLAANFGRKLKELIYTPMGWGIKNGRRTPIPGPIYGGRVASDHYDHVHVAMRRGGTVPGTGQGDTRPAMLEPGEFVIRKKVVQRFGPTFFAALNGGDGDGTGMGFMSGGQVARLARRAGFRGSRLVTALAVAKGESGWNENATNRNSNGSIDRGLWQINSVHGRLSTMNPLGNARAAWKISKGGRDWSPWVVFWKGLHRRHIAAARRAAIATRPGRGAKPGGGGGGGGGGAAPDRQEPHPLDVLPPIHERRMAVADIALARAEGTPGTADDLRAQQRKLAAIDTRIKRVRTALRKKLRPGTRARLRQEYAGLLRERQGLVTEMAPEVAETAAPFTYEDFQAQRTALAGLTPGLEDDLSAAQNAYQLAERRYMEALPTGDPRQIAEAANNVRAAADQVNQLREQMVSLEEQVRQAAEAERRLWPNAELAMAQLTETLDDDLQATEKLNAINESLYQQALAANDPARIAEAATNLKSTRDAIAQLNSTLEQQQAAEAERLRILESIAAEMKRENDRAEHINAITSREATRALGDLISGEIAGHGYSGRALTAGAGSVYRT